MAPLCMSFVSVYTLNFGHSMPPFALVSMRCTYIAETKVSRAVCVLGFSPVLLESRMVWYIATECSSLQTFLTISCTSSHAPVKSPVMANKKLGRQGVSGTTLNVMSVHDQTLLLRRISRCDLSIMYIRNVFGVAWSFLAFSFGVGAAMAIVWEHVIFAAVAKIRVRIPLCLVWTFTSLSKGIAISLLPRYLSQTPMYSKVAFG